MSQETTDTVNNLKQLKKKKNPQPDSVLPLSQQLCDLKQPVFPMATPIARCGYKTRPLSPAPARGTHHSPYCGVHAFPQPTASVDPSLVGRDTTPLPSISGLLSLAATVCAVNAVFLAPMLKTPDITAAAKVLTTKTAAKTIATQA